MADKNIEALKYPIGIQSFPELIEGGYVYVDKTAFVAKLLKEGKYYFLSRPRRFGKSLLLSTLHAFFEGRRELFKGLAIEKADVAWTSRPVLHFDLNAENFLQEDALENRLDEILRDYEEVYGKDKANVTLAQRFRYIIKSAHKQSGQNVAILVDEYDKPLLELEEGSSLYEKRQNILKGFFSNLKTMDDYIAFGMMTGVARFSKGSIFSDLNNLNDISMYEQFQEICGWTEEELTSTFRQGIEELAKKRRETPEETIQQLRNHYDGYLFSEEGNRMFNPYSVMRALYSRFIKPYWVEGGTPTFLAKRINKSGIDPEMINGQTQSYSSLMAVSGPNIVSLMYHTGILTIKSYNYRRQRYLLCFPNKEIEIGLAQHLLPCLELENSKK